MHPTPHLIHCLLLETFCAVPNHQIQITVKMACFVTAQAHPQVWRIELKLMETHVNSSSSRMGLMNITFVITPIVRDPASEKFPLQPQIRWIDDLMGPHLSKVTDWLYRQDCEGTNHQDIYDSAEKSPYFGDIYCISSRRVKTNMTTSWRGLTIRISNSSHLQGIWIGQVSVCRWDCQDNTGLMLNVW